VSDATTPSQPGMSAADAGLPRRSGHFATLARVALGDPRLLRDYIRAYRAGRSRATPAQAGAEATPWSPGEAPISIAAARGWVAAAAGAEVSPAGPALASVEAGLAQPPGGAVGEAVRIAAGLAGDPSLGELAYLIVRAVAPAQVVETGVAGGVTSAFVLAALADNGAGRLDSVDLPPLAMVSAGLVGELVPASLRERWSYHWGSSRRLLPGLLAPLTGTLDVFIHDSDHSYDGMRWELEAAWPCLRPGGWLVADDVHHHSAFADVAASVALDAVYVEQRAKGGCTGIIVKPRA
jgi:predicted O-methyltransferase YrrM